MRDRAPATLVLLLVGCAPTPGTLWLDRRDSGPAPEVRAVQPVGPGSVGEASLRLPAGEDVLQVRVDGQVRPLTGPAGAAPVAMPPRPPLCARDWSNSGGNAGRYGLSSESGPRAANALWSGARPSIISWQPVIEDDRMFVVRQLDFVGGEPDASPVVASDLPTGAELWVAHIPFNPGDWTTWIAGARDGRVYAGRSGNGASVSARLHALDAATGATLWLSDDETTAGPYDGVVFAPNGDLILGSFTNIMRIRATDGATVWDVPRTCSVSSSCGAAIHGDAVYVADATFGGHEIVRHDLATGAAEYASTIMTGFTLQNTPFVDADGTVYLSRSQNNVATDFFYAFDDTGVALVEAWRLAASWNTTSEFGVGPDGSVYMVVPGPEVARLDPVSGAVVDTSGVLVDLDSPRIATDSRGKPFVSNGAFSTGRVHVFEADLSPLWNVAVVNINIGGPVLGHRGVMLVSGIGSDVRAWQSVKPDMRPCIYVEGRPQL